MTTTRGTAESDALTEVEGLPSVLLLQVLSFLDHAALHAVEQTAGVFYDLIRAERTLAMWIWR